MQPLNQGPGYANAALELLAEFVHRELPGRSDAVLAVNGKNMAAQRLYISKPASRIPAADGRAVWDSNSS
ncbi:hypothetical protein [Paenibacillus sp. D9]|uniref:hypothetical protein n=1 Tax=Paenibacillus sp. D9 TaxID=665792 RepID=UPI0006762827|nr:hypothetical protein [Paenibacillus sp. D9]